MSDDGASATFESPPSRVYVGAPCPACDGRGDCPTCDGEGEVGDWVTLEHFRAMADVAAGDEPPLLV